MFKKLRVVECVVMVLLGFLLYSYHEDMNNHDNASTNQKDLTKKAQPADPPETQNVLLRDNQTVEVILTDEDRELIALDFFEFDTLTIEDNVMLLVIAKEYLSYNASLTNSPVTIDDQKTLISFLKFQSQAFKKNQLRKYNLSKQQEHEYLNLYLNLINNDSLIDLYRRSAFKDLPSLIDLKSEFDKRFAGYVNQHDKDVISWYVDDICSEGYNKRLNFVCDEKGKQVYQDVIGYALANNKKWTSKITGTSIENLDDLYDAEQEVSDYLNSVFK